MSIKSVWIKISKYIRVYVFDERRLFSNYAQFGYAEGRSGIRSVAGDAFQFVYFQNYQGADHRSRIEIDMTTCLELVSPNSNRCEGRKGHLSRRIQQHQPFCS